MLERGKAVNFELFAGLMADAPFQPATNFWRAIEVDAVIRRSIPMGRGLDLGCGDGRLTRLVLSCTGPRDIVGVDLDEAEARMAEKEGIYSGVHIAAATAIPEESGSFDFVFSNSVLEHIPELDGVLKEVARLLRPGGKLLITVPTAGFHACLRAPSRPEKRIAFYEDIDRRCAHVNYWDLETWRSHLAPLGMRITYSEAYLNESEVRRWQSISAWTGGLLYKIAGGRRRPIEIQRSLGMRSGRARLPMIVARWLAQLLAVGLKRAPEGRVQKHGCVLIEAERSVDAMGS